MVQARRSEAAIMMFRLSLEYGLLVFLAVTGVLQLAAIHNNLKKLLFFKRKVYGYILSAVIILPALVIFFTWNYRNATGIVQGSEQAGLFMLAMVLAVIFTLVLSSLLNHTRSNPPVSKTTASKKEGLDALRELTYFQALGRLFSRRS
jgi:hypothetical protein